MALLRTFGLSHTNLSLRCPLCCVLAGTKPLKICFICLCSSALTCEYVSKPRMPVMLLQSCTMRVPNQKAAVLCWDTQSALFKLLLLGIHEVLVNYSNQPQSRNSPSKQMAATAGSQETTFLLSSWRVGVDSISRHNSKWLSAPSLLSKGDMSALIYLWDRLPFTMENLPLIIIGLLLTLADLTFPQLLDAFNYSSPLKVGRAQESKTNLCTVWCLDTYVGLITS